MADNANKMFQRCVILNCIKTDDPQANDVFIVLEMCYFELH